MFLTTALWGELKHLPRLLFRAFHSFIGKYTNKHNTLYWCRVSWLCKVAQADALQHNGLAGFRSPSKQHPLKVGSTLRVRSSTSASWCLITDGRTSSSTCWCPITDGKTSASAFWCLITDGRTSASACWCPITNGKTMQKPTRTKLKIFFKINSLHSRYCLCPVERSPYHKQRTIKLWSVVSSRVLSIP